MASPVGKRSNEQLYCWEQVAKTNRLFRVSSAFAPPGHAERLLPLYALFSVIEEACSGVSDEQVARSKLAWWRQECLGRDPGNSSHPIIKELARGTHIGPRQQSCIARLLEDAEYRLDAAPVASLDDLARRCRVLGEPQLELELSLCGLTEPGTALPRDGLELRIGLAQLVRESLRCQQAGAYWWLPLDLLARHGVSRAGLRRSGSSKSERELFAEILHWGIGRADGLLPPMAGAADRVDSLHHLLVYDTLQSRLLRRLRSSSPERYVAEVNRVTLGDLYRAWQTARRVSRP